MLNKGLVREERDSWLPKYKQTCAAPEYFALKSLSKGYFYTKTGEHAKTSKAIMEENRKLLLLPGQLDFLTEPAAIQDTPEKGSY